MNEQVRPNTELTHGAVSHTLDAGSTMSEPPREQPPKNNSARNKTEATGSRTDQDAFSRANDFLRKNPELWEAMQKDPRATMEFFSRAGFSEHPEDRETRENIVGKRYGQRLDPNIDALNRLDPNNSEVKKPRSFSEIRDRARHAPRGEMGAEFLNSLFEDAASLELPGEPNDPDRVAMGPEFEHEREQTMDALKEMFHELNPSPRAEAKEAEIKQFRNLVKAASEASGGEITSIDTEEVKKIIDYLEKGFVFGGSTHEAVAEYLAEEKEARELMTEPVREILFEQIWERFVGRADKLPEDQHYRESLGGLQAQNVFDIIKGLAETGFVEEDGSNRFAYYLNELAHVRSNMHDLNAAFRVGDEYKKAVVQQISAKGLHFVQNDLTGVNSSIALWEKFLGDKVRERHQWLSQGDIDEVQKSVREALGEMRKVGLLKKEGKVWTKEEMDRAILLGDKKEGDPLKEEDRILTEWEIDRAARLGKITMAGTQRLAMYVGYGNIPPELQGRIGSIPYEYVARAIYNFKMTAPRFFNESINIAYMDKLFKYMSTREDGTDNGKFLELFGCDQRMVASNSLGAFDMESHSWRAQLLFLNNILLETPSGEKTLQEFLDDATYDNQDIKRDLVLEGIGSVPQEKIMKFLDETENTVLAQRLYLSVLTRLSLPSAKKDSSEAKRVAEIKENIWKKVAILKPSTIMSLLPNAKDMPGIDQKDWEVLRTKLYMAEMQRVQEDSHEVKDENGNIIRSGWASIAHEGHKPKAISKAQIDSEVDGFKAAIRGGNDTYKFQISRMKDKNGVDYFNATEKAIIERIINVGIAQAGKLSKAEYSQTLMIDDAPFTAWTNTGFGETGRGGMSSEDIVRILFSDQGAIAEGWGPVNGHVESPQTPAIEAYSTFVEKFGGVYGRKRAQEMIEAFILSDLEMYKMDTKSLWIGAIEKIANKPRSEIMKYDRDSQIAWDEKTREIYLKGLAQKNVISDNLVDAAFHLTQLDKLRKRTKSSLAWQWIRNLRILLQYGPVALLILAKNTFSESAKSATS